MLPWKLRKRHIIFHLYICHLSACELQPISCHDLANEIHSQTAKTVFSRLKERLESKLREFAWQSQKRARFSSIYPKINEVQYFVY